MLVILCAQPCILFTLYTFSGATVECKPEEIMQNVQCIHQYIYTVFPL